MTGLSEEDGDRVIAEATVAIAAATAREWLPKWFLALTDAHAAQREVFARAGDTDAARAFAEHQPCLDDGVICSSADSQYPCSELRKHHNGEGIWEWILAEVDKQDPGWRSIECGEAS